MKTVLLILSLACVSLSVNAADMGYRFNNGRCVNSQGQTGLNPSFLGQCADLSGVILARVNLEDMDLSGSAFANSDLQQTSFKNTILTAVNFAGAQLSGVDFSEAHIESANFQGAVLKNVSFAETSILKSNFTGVNFQGAQLSYFSAQESVFEGADFTNCTADFASFMNGRLKGAKFAGANLSESKFSGADVTEVSFAGAILTGAEMKSVQGMGTSFSRAQLKKTDLRGAKLEKANFRRASLAQADLRDASFLAGDFQGTDLSQATYKTSVWTGSTFSKNTVLPFTLEEATQLGMSMVKTANVLVIWDDSSDYFNRFLEAVSGDAEVTKTKEPEAKFDGSEITDDIDVVLHFNSVSAYAHDMSMSGQTALVNLVKRGGTYVSTRWTDFSIKQGLLKNMGDLILNDHTYNNAGNKFTVVAEQKQNPLLAGVDPTFTVMTGSRNIGGFRAFTGNQPTALITADGIPFVATRTVGEGTVIALNFACSYRGETCFDDKNIRTLYKNIVTP